jgi:hypothetical protein
LDVNVQDQYTQAVELYLHVHTAETTLASNASFDGTTIVVTSAIGMVIGQTITIRQGTRFYQSLIKNIAGTTITLQSPLDYAFTSGANVCAGDWNLKKNGSVTPVIAKICPPLDAKFDIYEFHVHLTDQTEMDSAKFGGLTALTNGILFRITDGYTKNLPLIVNNSGFQEHGFSIQYDDKAPAGYYGLHACKNYKEQNGVSFRLDGSTADTIELWIRDDLTALDLLSCTVLGHVVEEG